MHGCYRHRKKASGDNKVDNVDVDGEQGMYNVHILPQSSYASDQEKNLGVPEEVFVRQHAGTWGYVFQIIFQVRFLLQISYFTYRFCENSFILSFDIKNSLYLKNLI